MSQLKLHEDFIDIGPLDVIVTAPDGTTEASLPAQYTNGQLRLNFADLEQIARGRDTAFCVRLPSAILSAEIASTDSKVVLLADDQVAIDKRSRFVRMGDMLRRLGTNQHAVLADLAAHANHLRTVPEIYAAVWDNPHASAKRQNARVSQIIGEIRHQAGPILGDPQTGFLRTVNERVGNGASRRLIGYKVLRSLIPASEDQVKPQS